MSVTSNPQVLNVDYSHWSSRITVTDSTTGQVLFASNRSRGSTKLEVSDPSGQIIGSSKRSRLSSQINVAMFNPIPGAMAAGSDFEMNGSGNLLGSDPKYSSPAFSGQEMTWKSKWRFGKCEFVLVDERGAEVARFEGRQVRKTGTLEIMLDGDVGGENEKKLEEIVVTLLTLLVRKLKNAQNAQIGAAAGAS